MALSTVMALFTIVALFTTIGISSFMFVFLQKKQYKSALLLSVFLAALSVYAVKKIFHSQIVLSSLYWVIFFIACMVTTHTLWEIFHKKEEPFMDWATNTPLGECFFTLKTPLKLLLVLKANLLYQACFRLFLKRVKNQYFLKLKKQSFITFFLVFR